MQDTIEGRLRPRRSGRPALGNLVAVLLVLALAGAAWHDISTPTGAGREAEGKAATSANPSSQPRIEPPSVPAIREATPMAPVADVPTASPATAPATPLQTRRHHAPWWGLPVGAPPHIAYADRAVVYDADRTFQLESSSRVMSLSVAASGPVVLVGQGDGSTVLEQLRSNGTRLVLDTFDGTARFAMGLAVDPEGQRVAYGLAEVAGDARYRLVVRDLATGDRLMSRATRLPGSVEDWTAAGIVVTWAVDPGGPPLLWNPDRGWLTPITRHVNGGEGPFLLASAPDRAEWVVSKPGSGCTSRVSSLGGPAVKEFCLTYLYPPGAWSPDGDYVVAKSGSNAVTVLDLRTGSAWRVRSPRRGFVRELAWEDARSVLVVLDGPGTSSAVLRCQVDGRCERAELPRPGTSSLTLSR